MLSSDGHVKIVDFGIAKATEGLESTYTGSLKGKLSFMSPEQCRHDPVDRRSDVFTLGVVLWELCTGTRLFKRRTEMETLQAVADAEVRAPTEIDPNFPVGLSAVIMKALEQKPENRHATAEELRLELLQVADECRFRLGEDRVALFVDRVGGDLLDERQHAIREATEQPARVVPPPVRLPAGDVDEETTAVDSPRATLARDIRTAARVPIEPPAGLQVPRALLVLAALVVLTAAVVVTAHFSRPHDLRDEPFFDMELGDKLGPAAPFLGDPLVVAWPPYVDADLLARDMAPFREYLERALARPVEFRITADYSDCAAGVIQGSYDVAALSPFLYVDAAARDEGLALLAVKQFDGAETYESLLLVRADSQAHELADLQDARFCFPDQDSTSGYVIPMAAIRRAGFEPDDFIGSIQWSGDHLQALRDIMAARCDVVGTYNGALFAADVEGLPVGSLRHLAVVGIFPQDVLVASSFMSEAERKTIRQALLDFTPQEHVGAPRAGNIQRITGFSPISEDAFGELRDILAESAD